MGKELTFVKFCPIFTTKSLLKAMSFVSKHTCLLVFLGLTAVLHAQPGEGPQAIVTIIGDPVQGNYINNEDGNPYNNNTNAPPPQSQMAELSNQQASIDPSLENGFHVRFELESPAISERSSSGYMSSGGSGKTKKHAPTMAERSFNVKKKIKSLLPKRKKRYRPHLCGRF